MSWAEAMPLADFPADKRLELEEAIALPKPPPRWIKLGQGATGPLAEIPSRAWYEWHWARGIDPDKKRESLGRRLREAIIRRDGLICGLCGGGVERTDVHIDHVVPWSHGGSDEPSNLQVTHSACNMAKGARV